MARTFKLGSIVVKVSRSTVTVTTSKAAKAASRAKGRAARRIRILQRALNNARREREEVGDKLVGAFRQIDSLKASLKAWEEGRAMVARAVSMPVTGTTVRKVKQSRNPATTAARVETLHRVID